MIDEIFMEKDSINFKKLRLKDKEVIGSRSIINIAIPYGDIDKLLYSNDNVHTLLLLMQIKSGPAKDIMTALKIPPHLKRNLDMDPESPIIFRTCIYIMAKKDPKNHLNKMMDYMPCVIEDVTSAKYSDLLVYKTASKASYNIVLRYVRAGQEIPREIEMKYMPPLPRMTDLDKEKDNQQKQLTDIAALKRDHFLATKLQEQEYAFSHNRTTTRSLTASSKNAVVKPASTVKTVFTIDLLDDDDEREKEPQPGSSQSSEGTNGKGKKDDELLFNYPPGEKHPVPVYRSDLKCLAKYEFLNDNIIDFYLK
jgi:hypothetical protein